MVSAVSTTVVGNPGAPPTALDMFRARCEARAHLWAVGEIDELADAADALQEHAIKHGLVKAIGQDAVQAIMADAFKPFRAGEGLA
jgi:hypothetical protein